MFVSIMYCLFCLCFVVCLVTFPKLQRVGTQIMVNSIIFFYIKLIDMFNFQIYLFTVIHGS